MFSEKIDLFHIFRIRNCEQINDGFPLKLSSALVPNFNGKLALGIQLNGDSNIWLK